MTNGQIGAVVQARIGSARLPGKVVMPLAGRPALAWLRERLARVASLDAVIVATSTDDADDAVADLCLKLGLACHRGPHDDVASRLLEAAERFRLEAFVRVNGDSPLLDQALVKRGVSLFRQGGRDLVTNVFPRSFPRGQSIEVLRTDTLRAALPRMTQPGDREHVTAALYRDPAELSIENFTAGADTVGSDGGSVRLVLDTPEDAVRIEGILAAMQREHWQYDWKEVLALARALAVPS